MPSFILPFWSRGAICNNDCCLRSICCCWPPPSPWEADTFSTLGSEGRQARRQRHRVLAHDDFLVGRRGHGSALRPRLVAGALFPGTLALRKTRPSEALEASLLSLTCRAFQKGDTSGSSKICYFPPWCQPRPRGLRVQKHLSRPLRRTLPHAPHAATHFLAQVQPTKGFCSLAPGPPL